MQEAEDDRKLQDSNALIETVKQILRYLHGTVEHGMLIRRSSGSTLQAFNDVLLKDNPDTSLKLSSTYPNLIMASSKVLEVFTLLVSSSGAVLELTCSMSKFIDTGTSIVLIKPPMLHSYMMSYSARRPLVRVDPKGRCAAIVIYGIITRLLKVANEGVDVTRSRSGNNMKYLTSQLGANVKDFIFIDGEKLLDVPHDAYKLLAMPGQSNADGKDEVYICDLESGQHIALLRLTEKPCVMRMVTLRCSKIMFLVLGYDNLAIGTVDQQNKGGSVVLVSLEPHVSELCSTKMKGVVSALASLKDTCWSHQEQN
ncbi:hypothetical protein Tco_0520196 [Tanacetum coccineum]